MNNAVAKGVEEEIAATIDTSTINGRLRAHMATQGGSPAIWIAPGQSRSFSQMYDIVDHIAAALRRHVEVVHPRIAFATRAEPQVSMAFLPASSLERAARSMRG